MPYDVVAFSTDEDAFLWTLEEEGAFHRLMRHAWINGSIPDDMTQLANICRCSGDVMERMWIRLQKAWPKRGKTGRRVNPKQEQERKFLEYKRDVNKENAEKRWSERNATALRTDKQPQSKRNAPRPNPSLPSPSPSANTESISSPISPPPAEERGGQSDSAADLFCLRHQERMGTAYVSHKSDFVQLAALRKANHVPARASPEGWEVAVENYFASPLGKCTLADLAVRFPVFRNSAVDGYGKPVNHVNGAKNAKPKENANDRATADYLRRAMAPALQSDVPDVWEDS